MTWAQAAIEALKLLRDIVEIVVIGAVALLFLLKM